MRLRFFACLMVGLIAACDRPSPATGDPAVGTDGGGALSDGGATSADDAGPLEADAGANEIDAGPAAPDAGTETPDAGSVIPGDCSTLTIGPGNYDWTVTHGGTSRQFHVHVPASYQTTAPTPVVLTFHGLSSSAAEIETQSVMTPVSDEKGFIVAYPQGTGNSWNAGKCCNPAATSTVDDVGFVRAMLDQLAQKLCVDPKRVYATGLSNGAYMSHRLGCELSDRIAAIAPVAGMNVTNNCAPSRPVPVMHFHGTSDYVVPWAGNLLYGFQSVPDSIKQWRTIDECTAASTQTFQNGDSTCDTYAQCTAANVEVTLCTIDGGGHTWPGGKVTSVLGKTTTDLDASRHMWQFFASHPMP
jgi:polyhydroxybutyrate depolymerase